MWCCAARVNVLHGHGSPDETVASIALEVEILQGVIGDVGRQTVELQCGVRERLVAELLIDLVVVVVVCVVLVLGQAVLCNGITWAPSRRVSK